MKKQKGVDSMKFKKHLLKITATVLSAVMLLSSVCITAFAADIKTPIGYIEAVPTSVAQDDVLSDPAYLRYKQFIEVLSFPKTQS